MTDPIADMLTRIRNAIAVQHKTVLVPHSNTKESIAKTLEKEGYINGFSIEKTDYGQPNIIVELKYNKKEPVISVIQRVSKPGRRVYTKHKQLKPILSGHGVSIISTSQGLMTNIEAKRKKLGGEVICQVW